MFRPNSGFVLVSVQVSVWVCWEYKHNCRHPHRDQIKYWYWLRTGWRLAWLALDQDSRWLGAQRRARHHYEWAASSPNKGVGELRQAWRGAPDCHWGACLLWLVINYGICNHFISQRHSCSSDLPGRWTSWATHCSLVWLPSGRTWALRTGAHSPGTPAWTRQPFSVSLSPLKYVTGSLSSRFYFPHLHSHAKVSVLS